MRAWQHRQSSACRVHCKCELHLHTIFPWLHCVVRNLEEGATIFNTLQLQLTVAVNNSEKSYTDFIQHGFTDIHLVICSYWVCCPLLLLEKTSWLLRNHWITCHSSIPVLWQSTLCFSSHQLLWVVQQTASTIWKNLCKVHGNQSSHRFHWSRIYQRSGS